MEALAVTGRSVWLTRLWGRNALVRVSDRLEGLLTTAAVLTAVLFVPFAAAIGTVAHETLSHTYAQHARERQEVKAYVADMPEITLERTQLIVVAPLVWRVNGEEHRTFTEVKASLRAGDSLDIWIDREGNPTLAPPPAWRAGAEAIVLAAAAWFAAAGVIALISALIRKILHRRRDRDWDRDLQRLTTTDEGRADRES